MCPEEDSASVEWVRQKDENWVNKDITSLEFVENIFRLMNWNRECRYKVLGRVANSDQGLCMLFDLEEAIMFTPKPQEYTDPLTGEMKKKQMKFFPDTYRNRIGKSYNDYIADKSMPQIEDWQNRPLDEVYPILYMMRRTFLTSALDMPEIMLYIYSKSWKLQFSASSSIIIIEDYYLQTFLHSLSGFPSCWSPSVYSR